MESPIAQVNLPTPVANVLPTKHTPYYIHAIRADRRESTAALEVSVPTIHGDYSYYAIIENNAAKEISTWPFGIDGNVFLDVSEAEKFKLELQAKYPNKNLGLLHGYFSLDVESMANHVHYYDSVELEAIQNPYEREWLKQCRVKFNEAAQKYSAKKIHSMFSDKPAKDNKPKFEPPQATNFGADWWIYFSVLIKGFEIHPFGIGYSVFYTHEEAVKFKVALEVKYPELEFGIIYGGFDADYISHYKAAELGEFKYKYEREWVRLHRERVAALVATLDSEVASHV